MLRLRLGVGAVPQQVPASLGPGRCHWQSLRVMGWQHTVTAPGTIRAAACAGQGPPAVTRDWRSGHGGITVPGNDPSQIIGWLLPVSPVTVTVTRCSAAQTPPPPLLVRGLGPLRPGLLPPCQLSRGHRRPAGTVTAGQSRVTGAPGR